MRDPLGTWTISRVAFLTASITAVGAGLILPRVWSVNHLRFLVLQALVIIVGSAGALYSILPLASAGEADKHRKATSLDASIPLMLISVLLPMAMPFLVFDAMRAGYRTPLDFNEGWNLFHTSSLLHGGPLYPALVEHFPIVPVNYPPLSFVLLGALGHLTGSPLITGRIVSILALLCITYLVYRIIDNFSGNRPAAALGGLFWLALMVREGQGYIGMYDPQLLGQVFSVGALYLYSKWLDHLTPLRASALALLCCLAMFIKLMFLAVPLALALEIFLRNRARAGTFVVTGIAIFASLMLASWAYWGNEMLHNLLVELARQHNSLIIFDQIQMRFFSPLGFVLLQVFIVLFLTQSPVTRVILIYLLTSFAVGSYGAGAAGVGPNTWFDLFVAAAIAAGLFAAEVPRLKTVWARGVLYGLLACTVLPLVLNFGADLGRALDYGALRRDDQDYRRAVAVLRSIPGPALFDTPLVAFDAGKEFLFDPFWGSEMMVAGRMPESILTSRIRQQYFGVIVLSFDLHEQLVELRNSMTFPRTPATSVSRWTDNTLIAIGQNYESLDPRTPHRSTHCYEGSCPVFYVPRKSGQLAVPVRHLVVR